MIDSYGRRSARLNIGLLNQSKMRASRFALAMFPKGPDSTMRLVIILSTALALSPIMHAQTAEPWKWTHEQRLGIRLDPHHIAERVRNSGSGRATAETSPTTAQPPFVIEGAKNGELFMPFELIQFLLDGTLQSNGQNAQAVEAVRRSYRPWLAYFQWEPVDFWSSIETFAYQYSRAVEENLMAPPLEGPLPSRDISAESRVLCAARIEVLDQARRTFGRAKFDEFLYRAVAPRFSVAGAVVVDAPTLLWIEGGCQ